MLWILKLCYSGCLLVLFLTKMSSLVTTLKLLPCTEITLKEILELTLGSNVKSEDNPCDLLTRGLTFAEFQQKYDFWFHGPLWLTSSLDNWPQNKHGCLSEANKLQLKPSKVTTSTNATFVQWQYRNQ